MDSNDQPALGICLNKANMPLDGEVPTVSPPSVEEVGLGAPSGVVIAPTPPPKPTSAGPRKKRLPDRLLVSTYVPPLERVHPSMNMVALDLEDVLKIMLRISGYVYARPLSKLLPNTYDGPLKAIFHSASFLYG